MSDLNPDEAEIEASRAPLLDHLIELRSRLIVCVASIIVGFGVCFFFITPIYQFLTNPFELAGQIFAARDSLDLADVIVDLISIQEVLDGDLGEIVNSLVAHSQAEKLKVARPGAA